MHVSQGVGEPPFGVATRCPTSRWGQQAKFESERNRVSSGTHRDLRILFAAWLTCLATGPIAAQDQRPRSERPASERAAEQPTMSSRRGAESTGKQQTRRLPAFPWSALRASDDSPASPAEGALPLAPRPGDLIRLGTKDGQIEWSTWGDTFEKFLEFLRCAKRTRPLRSRLQHQLDLDQGDRRGRLGQARGDFRDPSRTARCTPHCADRPAGGLDQLPPKHSGPGEFRAAIRSIDRRGTRSICAARDFTW